MTIIVHCGPASLGAKYCDKHICLSVCPRVCRLNCVSDSQQFPCLHVPRPCIVPRRSPALQYVMYFRFYEWRHICTRWLRIDDAIKACAHQGAALDRGGVCSLRLACCACGAGTDSSEGWRQKHTHTHTELAGPACSQGERRGRRLTGQYQAASWCCDHVISPNTVR